MSATKIKILKQCLNCGNMFESQKISSRTCSQKCCARYYKLRKRLEKKEESEAQFEKVEVFRPKVSALNIALLKEKEFLSVRELAVLLGCSRPTIYKLIDIGKIKATNLGIKQTLIKRSNIDNLFK